jgi:hypothetical protein
MCNYAKDTHMGIKKREFYADFKFINLVLQNTQK